MAPFRRNGPILALAATGTSVDVVSLTNSLSVEPNLSKLAAALTPILEAHAANPVAARLIASAGKLSSVKPTPMYSTRP
ncbi:MAG TPA: hypothetical protein VGG75_40695 [Trebonia sp.]|jgi:hypothetical protein